MPKINLKLTNSKLVMIVTFLLLLSVIIIFFIPLLLINFIPQSAIGNYFTNNWYFAYSLFPVILYVVITGIHYYNIKIDAYIMYFISYRTIFALFMTKNYIEVPHDMLSHFSFFNRPFSFNKTLMLKINDVNGKKTIKRFTLSFLSKNNELKITKTLKQIIAKNS